MKRKLLLTALAAVCTVSSAIGLSACAKHEHDFSGEWEKDAANHWHECLGEDCAEVADSAAHTYGNWTVTTTATEERDGERKRECTVCGYEQTETISKLQHTHKFADGWTKDETGHWHAATCEHTTEKDGFAAHAYGQWIEVTPATEDAKGSEKRVCSVCEYEETREIAQLDHTHSYKTEWAYDNSNHWHACNKADCPSVSDSAAHTLTETVTSPATIDAAGSKKIECTVCDYEKTESIPMLASKNYEVTLLDKTGAPVEGVTVKLGKYSAETDEYGKATVKAELAEYTVVLENTPSAVTYDELAKVTAENSQTTIYFAERANGGRVEESPYELTDGVYAALLNAVRSDMPANDGSYNYDVAARYFSVTATDGAVTARMEILNDNTLITSNDTDMLLDKGAYYEVVVEQGERTVFCVTSADETITEDYTFTVFFKVSRSEAPDIGVYERPVRLADGAESVTAVESATQKVYYRLDNRVFGKYATVEFGSGVKVYYLGYNKTGDGTEITSGQIIDASEYVYTYLYAVSTGENCTLTANTYHKEGMKQNPFTVTVGEANNPEFDIAEGTREQWYKLQVSADGTYIIKSEANHAILEIYNDVNGEAVKTASGGAGVSVVVAANTPVYIRAASNMNQTYAFTVTEFSDTDKGVSKDAPLALTSTGDYNVYTTRYYTYTATQNERVTLTVSNVGHSVYFYHHTDETYDDTKLVGGKTFANTLSFLAEAGKTYYFHTNTEANGGTMTLAVETLAAHDHVITVSGADSKADITVKVMNGNTEVASSTTDANGSVTLNFIPGNYKIVLGNVPAGYGYFANYALTALNDSETSYIDVKLYALADYSLTIKKPDGTGAAGITVTFTNEITGTFTAETDENGVAKITDKLPPMVKKQSDGTIGTGGSFAVTFELPEILSGDFIYTGDAISLTSATKTSEKTLTNMFAYVLTLVDGDNNALPAGIDVTLMNGSTIMATATTVEGGIATFTKIVAGEYTVALSNNYVTEAKTSATANTLTAICTSSGGGAIDGGTAKAPALINGSGTHSIKVAEGATGYFQFSGNGKKYTITVSGSYFYVVRLNGTGASNKVIQGNAISLGENVSDSDVAISAKNDSGQVTSFTLTISDYVYFGIKGAFEGTITITEVTE